jgi:hypothetical protein
MGLTIHFENTAPDALEQWLSTEARYIIGTFSKPSDLQKVYGSQTEALIAECKLLGENIVGGITMILDGELRRLYLVLVRLRNGNSFIIDSKYALVRDAETGSLLEKLILEGGPRVFSVTSR